MSSFNQLDKQGSTIFPVRASHKVKSSMESSITEVLLQCSQSIGRPVATAPTGQAMTTFQTKLVTTTISKALARLITVNFDEICRSLSDAQLPLFSSGCHYYAGHASY